MRRSIRPDQAIDTEVDVVDRIAEIAAISPISIPFFVVLQQTLVHPIPDEAPLQTVVLSDRLPIFLEVAGAVAYLVEEESGYITGANLPVNGGLYMS